MSLSICFLELSDEFPRNSKTCSNKPRIHKTSMTRTPMARKRAIGVRVIEGLLDDDTAAIKTHVADLCPDSRHPYLRHPSQYTY